MTLKRTTLRLKSVLKKKAEKYALEEDTTLQDIFNTALEEFLRQKAKNKAKKLAFKTHDLGTQLDNLTRSDYYKSPR